MGAERCGPETGDGAVEWGGQQRSGVWRVKEGAGGAVLEG